MFWYIVLLGHIIHIDFGFMLSNSPGNINFESAPFKLTNVIISILLIIFLGISRFNEHREFLTICVFQRIGVQRISWN